MPSVCTRLLPSPASLGGTIVICGFALVAGSVAASAQPRATFPAGFQPDPYTVNVASGGPIDVGTQIAGCSGRISDTPSFVLAYEGGGRPLSFYGWSAADTTLVVHGADGQFYCDDDGMGAVVGTLDPLLTIANAPPGIYTVWVGNFGDNRPAILGITTRGPYEILASVGVPAALVRSDRLVATPPARPVQR